MQTCVTDDDGNGSRFIGWIRDGWNGLTDRLERSGSRDDPPGRSARTEPTESPEPDLTPPRREAPPMADAPDPAWSRDTSLVREAKCIQGCAEELSLSRLRELTESDSSICAVLVGIQIDIAGRPVTTSVLESSGHESCDEPPSNGRRRHAGSRSSRWEVSPAKDGSRSGERTGEKGSERNRSSERYSAPPHFEMEN